MMMRRFTTSSSRNCSSFRRSHPRGVATTCTSTTTRSFDYDNTAFVTPNNTTGRSSSYQHQYHRPRQQLQQRYYYHGSSNNNSNNNSRPINYTATATGNYHHNHQKTRRRYRHTNTSTTTSEKNSSSSSNATTNDATNASRGNPLSEYWHTTHQAYDEYKDSCLRLLSPDKYPVGSYTPETWFEAEDVLPFMCIQRTVESVDLSFQLLHRLLEEKASTEHQRQKFVSEWLIDDDDNEIDEERDIFNRILNNWRVVWWDDNNNGNNNNMDNENEYDEGDFEDDDGSDQPTRQQPTTTARTLSELGLTPSELLNRVESGVYRVPLPAAAAAADGDGDSPQYSTLPINEKSLYLLLEASISNSGGGNEEPTPAQIAKRIFDIIISLDHRENNNNGNNDDNVYNPCRPSTMLCHLMLRTWLLQKNNPRYKNENIDESWSLRRQRGDSSEEAANNSPSTAAPPYDTLLLDGDGNDDDLGILLTEEEDDDDNEAMRGKLGEQQTNAATTATAQLISDIEIAELCQKLIEYMITHNIEVQTRTLEAVLLAWTRVPTRDAAIKAQQLWEHFYASNHEGEHHNDEYSDTGINNNNSTDDDHLQYPRVKPTVRTLATVLMAWGKASGSCPMLASRYAHILTEQLHTEMLGPHRHATSCPRHRSRDYVVALNCAMRCHLSLADTRTTNGPANTTGHSSSSASAANNEYYGTERDSQEALHYIIELFDMLEHHQPNYVQPNTTSYRRLLQAYGHLGYYQQAKESLLKYMDLYSNFSKGGRDFSSSLHPPEPVMFSSALTALARSRHRSKVQEANEIYGILQDGNMRPNRYIYNALLDCYASSRDAEERPPNQAQKLLEEMKARANDDDSLKPDVISYGTVMKSWSKWGHPQRAHNLFHEMVEERGIQPDLQCYNTVFSAYAKSKNQDACVGALKLFKQMRDSYNNGTSDCKPDVYSYTSVISAFASSTRSNRKESSRRAHALLRELQKEYRKTKDPSLRPHRATYNAVMNGFCRAYKPERAEALLEEMYNDYRGGNVDAMPDVSSFNTLVKAWAFVSSRKPEARSKAEEIIERMNEWSESGVLENVAPNMISYTTLMLCYGLYNTKHEDSDGGPQRCDEILRHMDELYKKGRLDRAPTKRTFNTLRKCWQSSNEPNKETRIKEIRQEMKRRFGSS